MSRKSPKQGKGRKMLNEKTRRERKEEPDRYEEDGLAQLFPVFMKIMVLSLGIELLEPSDDERFFRDVPAACRDHEEDFQILLLQEFSKPHVKLVEEVLGQSPVPRSREYRNPKRCRHRC